MLNEDIFRKKMNERKVNLDLMHIKGSSQIKRSKFLRKLF